MKYLLWVTHNAVEFKFHDILILAAIFEIGSTLNLEVVSWI